MNFQITEKEVKEYVKERFLNEYPGTSNKKFNELWNEYKEIPEFKINGNVFDVKEDYNDQLHLILRLVSAFYLTKTFGAMKIDMNDPNVWEESEIGNISTPGRVIKMWTGHDTHDDRELMGGRFHVPVRLASFPNEISEQEIINPIIKEVDLGSVCSHHLMPFNSEFAESSKVLISYIPDKFVLGISKLQRVVRYVAQRGWLQEDLTKAIYEEIRKAAGTDSVYVGIRNIKHLCEWIRGAKSNSDGFTTEFYGGHFKEKYDLLENVRNHFKR